MNNKILKFCGIREDLKDYTWIDLLWFNFIDISKRKITEEKAISIKTPKSVMRVWLFWNYDLEEKGWQNLSEKEIEEIIEKARKTNMQWLQIYWIKDFEQFKNAWFYTICPISYEDIDSFIADENIDLLIIDSKNPWSWKWYDYSSLWKKKIKKPFLIAWWISKENIWEAAKEVSNCLWFDIASWADNWDNLDENKIKTILRDDQRP